MDQAAATRLIDGAPTGAGWLHEIKYDGYRMHARIDGRDIKLLTHQVGLVASMPGDGRGVASQLQSTLGPLMQRKAHVSRPVSDQSTVSGQSPLLKRDDSDEAVENV